MEKSVRAIESKSIEFGPVVFRAPGWGLEFLQPFWGPATLVFGD